MSGDDRDLQACFAALRREDEAGVPPFSILTGAMRASSMAARGARRQGRRRLYGGLAAAALCVAAMIAAGVWLMPGFHGKDERWKRGRERAEASIPDSDSITTWKPATDFLLETPGRELLQGVPAIGEDTGAAIGRSRSERRRRLGKQVRP